jgi:adenine-specific DNA-methyltransferase
MPERAPAWNNVPIAGSDECPVQYADRLGHWYAQHVDDDHRRAQGYYLTPQPVARFMGAMCRGAHKSRMRIMDPAAGTGILMAAACTALASTDEKPSRIDVACYELDAGLRAPLRATLAHLTRWLSLRKVRLEYRIEWRDFILTNAGALEGGILPSGEPAFDIVIANPPYFKVAKEDPRALATSRVVKGQPNIYALFMAVSAAMLREDGNFSFITPRSFASGPYFQRFREVFFNLIKPTHIHVFNSRRRAFDDVLQETVTTCGKRQTFWSRTPGSADIAISTSAGADDLNCRSTRQVALSEVLVHNHRQTVLHLPADAVDDRIRALVNSWPGSLHAYDFEVSTGPVVAFRAREALRSASGKNVVPLLWLQHVKPMRIEWPVRMRNAQFVVHEPGTARLLLPNLNYVVLRRFTAKEERRRLTAAPYFSRYFEYPRIGFENHLNYIWHRAGRMDAITACGLSAVLNCPLLDRFVRISSGNTQVSATELRSLPLPDIEMIRRIGRRVITRPGDYEEIVAKNLGYAS